MGDGMDPDTPERREINRVARLLIAEWERVEHCRLAASAVASFADMARVVIDDRAARSADMEARIRALVSDWQANGNSRELGDPTDAVWFKCAEQLLALLDAAPAGGAEAVGGYDFAKVRREAHERYEQEFDAPSEVPHV